MISLMNRENPTSWEDYLLKENVFHNSFYLSSCISTCVDTLTLGTCLRNKSELSLKCLNLPFCVLNCEDLIASI